MGDRLTIPVASFIGGILCLLLGGAGIDNHHPATAICFFVASFVCLVACCIVASERLP